MTTSWKSGLGLAVLLAVAGAASAQPRGDFKKPLDGGRGVSDAERVRNEMKALEGQIDRLRNQIDQLSRQQQAARAPEKGRPGAPEGKGKFGPPDGKKGFEKKGPPPQQAKGPEARRGFEPKAPPAPQAKGGPPWAEMRKAMEEKMRSAQQARNAPPAAAPKGPPQGWGRFPGPSAGPWGPPRAAATPATRAPSADLEARVNRLERAVDELRREIRGRR